MEVNEGLHGVHVIVRRGEGHFLALVPLLSSIVPLRNRTAAAWIEALRTLRWRAYDVALDFQGLLKSAALARLSGAARVIGSIEPRSASVRQPGSTPSVLSSATRPAAHST